MAVETKLEAILFVLSCADKYFFRKRNILFQSLHKKDACNSHITKKLNSL